MVKFTEFLFKRISTKLDDIANAGSHQDVTAYVEDMESYVDALKMIVTEVIKP